MAFAGDMQMTDEAWQSVLRAVDQAYSELVAHQEDLEEPNTELAPPST